MMIMKASKFLMLNAIVTVALVSITFASDADSDSANVFRPVSIAGSQDVLSKAEMIQLKLGAFGAESIAFDPNGEGPYTGVADGRILKWLQHAQVWVDFAVTSSQRKNCSQASAPEMEHICGRPLGLRFDHNTGDLYIADAYLGLQVVGPTGGLASPLVQDFEGQPLSFTNDLDIDDHDNVIYFTDTSTIYQRRQFVAATASGDKTGRLMKYDKSTKQVTAVLRGLSFANGVALSKDRSFVLVAETSACRILRYWLKGPNVGTHDTFAELPGFPDNVRTNSKGEFWVALHAKASPLSRLITSNSWLGKTLLRKFNFQQMHSLLVGGQPHATAIKLSEEGVILEVLEDVEGKKLRFISEVHEEDNGKLWIGSVMMSSLGVYQLS
ncbi:protein STRICTOSIDINE SYNTHASE-LIKE 10-like [Lycium ferocissimum]|uniref:protein STRICTOSIDINE SYNTHASE-LIKE 10-like n=1 Tax=Lycium ferocissimum TaxID=112874 RepID=UPI0028150C71|nr:protein STRICTOSIDINE SYNTHASE-LIKE 10-like [Lycium ferocissimum]